MFRNLHSIRMRHVPAILSILGLLLFAGGSAAAPVERGNPAAASKNLAHPVFIVDTQWDTAQSSSIHIVDLSQGRVVNTIPVGYYPQVQPSVDGQSLWVVESKEFPEFQLSRYSVTTGELIASMPLTKYVSIPALYYPQLAVSQTHVFVSMQKLTIDDPLRMWVSVYDAATLQKVGEVAGCEDRSLGHLVAVDDRLTITCNSALLNYRKVGGTWKAAPIQLTQAARKGNLFGHNVGAVQDVSGTEVYAVTDTGVLRKGTQNLELGLPDGNAVVINAVRPSSAAGTAFVGTASLEARGYHLIEDIWEVKASSSGSRKLVHLPAPVLDFDVKDNHVLAITKTDVLVFNISSGELVQRISDVMRSGLYMK